MLFYWINFEKIWNLWEKGQIKSLNVQYFGNQNKKVKQKNN